ncbi:glycosyltransferase family 2 protein [Desulfobacca acetoxidans]|uniref:Glycosyl transferase family 2 n=1 Tax=Desulfobacca acetoxidans (strain ATCC 700848 / DSM 11109 / ASRB2) TaxID=880072 RepID=F2NC04_DESAR|nr:cellulose synthase catalytic subunit [Desulfobacca acetoxidans]AEB08081.1 glycosyl transferase family 2 [Desulfobacca acetoxidans DSM 11109]
MRAQFFCLLTLLSGAVYLAWLAQQAYQVHALHTYLFLFTELSAYTLLFAMSLDVWQRRYHRPEGIEPDAPFSVDVFVTSCGESLEIIQATLAAIQKLNYSHYTVYVLDDAGKDAVLDVCRSFGFHYLSRPRQGIPQLDAKSGNLNFGLSQSHGDIILVQDADQIPHPDIISRLIGFFRLPRVAYVQSRQAFLLPDGDPFYNRDDVFYETIQLSNDQVNAVISCGSGVLYRRQALKEIGGFTTWNLVEDFTTSYELVSRGWQGIYFPYALSRGLAPDTLQGVYQQRYQWCLDTMRLFFWDNPFRKSGLSFLQRLHFSLTMMAYIISGLILPIFFLLPLYCYFTGKTFLVEQEWNYLSLRGIYLLCTILAFRYLFFKNDSLKQFKMLCGLFPVYALGVLSAMWYPPGHKPRYKVNHLIRFKPLQNFFYILPHLSIITLHLSLPFLSLALGWAAPRLIAANAFFSAFTIWVLGEMIILALSRPKWTAPNLPD